MTVRNVPTTEGYVQFNHPSLPADKPCQTWYRVVGDLENAKQPPLVMLHGGPGATHIYLTVPFETYAAEHDTAVVFYDQIGCGRSTHYREKRLDEKFWIYDLFVAELVNLVGHLGIRDSFDLLGHSWGAMLGGKVGVYAATTDLGLGRLILASGPCNMKDWEAAADIMIAEQPKEAQEIIRRTQKSQKWDDPEYKAAVEEIYKLHVCRLPEWPQIVLDTFAELERDDTSYMTMQGPDELVILGTFRDFDMREECKAIKVPTLVINGEYDECMDFVAQPWWDGINKSKWVVVPGGSHMSNVEFPEKYSEIVWRFLGN